MVIEGCHIICLRAGLPAELTRHPESVHDGAIPFTPESDIVLLVLADVRGIAVSAYLWFRSPIT
jgi:hypothetical protein